MTDIHEIIKKFKTPFYLYDTSVLRERTELMKQKLPHIGLCFAMKAAPVLAGYIAGMVDRLEVCSPGEYEICIRNDVPPEKLLVSGVNKTYDSIRRILKLGNGQGIYTIESPEHFEILNKCACEAGVKLRCYIRLSSGNQFGVDAKTLEMLAVKVLKSEWLELAGIHFFSGTQKTLKRIEAELTALGEYGPELMRKLSEASPGNAENLQEQIGLEFGPGLGVDYFFDPGKTGGAENITSGRSVEKNKAADALDSLREIVEKTGIRKIFKHITFEHGRFIAASTGRYFTGIADIKTTDGVNYVILEGGIHQLTYYGSMAGMKVPYITVISPDGTIKGSTMSAAEDREDYVLAGSLCSINDIIVRKAALPALSKDDILMFDLAGAYALTEGIGLFLSRDLPAVLIRNEDGNVRLIRDHIETHPINDGSIIKI